jgi:hypothetical protein
VLQEDSRGTALIEWPLSFGKQIILIPRDERHTIAGGEVVKKRLSNRKDSAADNSNLSA